METDVLATPHTVQTAPPANHPDADRATRSRHAMPSVRPIPLLGWRAVALRLLRDPVLGLLRLQRTHGDIFALGPEAGALVCTFAPAYNRQLLTDTALFYNLDVTDSAAPVRMPPHTAAARLLSGVAGMNGARHKQQRHLLLPGFHRQHVASLRDTLVDCIERHVAGWPMGGRIEVAHEMVELSLSLAIRGLLGLDPVEEGRHVRRALALWNEHGLSPQVAFLPYNVRGLPYQRFLKVAEDLEGTLYSVIARKRERGLDGGDALSILLQARDENEDALTDVDLLGHLTTFFTAGHETTASALTWTLFLLAQHPRILADLTDELDGALHGAAPRLDQLSQLPLLANVINEGLRMFPPSMWLLRTTTAPCALGPYELSGGTHIVLSPAVTHYREDIYDQPHRFLPRRWETISPSPYEYLPFGAGPRRCLGATFAMLELQLALSIIVQRYHLTIPEGTRVDRGGTILSTPKGGLPMQLHPRGRHYAPTHVRGNIHELVRLES